MRHIPWDSWPRKEIFDFFSACDHPFFSVTFQVDVTKLHRFCRERGLSFYYALVFLSTKAINSVEAFRYLLSDGQLFLAEERAPSFTDLKPGSELFHIVTMPCGENLETFCRMARKKSMEQASFLDQSAETGDLIYFSCLPWVQLTALTNERALDPDDSVPRIAWGKFQPENGREVLHISLELNHRFVDGIHVGKFYEALCRLMDTLEDQGRQKSKP